MTADKLLWMRLLEKLTAPQHSVKNSLLITFHLRFQGIARTQSPTTRNYALDLPTFGVIAGVNPTEMQWKGLALGDRPC